MKNIILHFILLFTIAHSPVSYTASSSSPSSCELGKQAQEARQLADLQQMSLSVSSESESFYQKCMKLEQARELQKRAEKKWLESLYKNYEKNTHFYKTEEIDCDYALQLLSEDIKKLEKESSPKDIEATRYVLISFALFASTTSFMYFGGLEAIFDLFFQHWGLIRGKFNTIYLPYSLFEKLKSSKVSFKEKKYLKRFKVNEVYCAGSHWHYNDSQKEDYYAWPRHNDKLPARDKDKLKYIALRNEIQQHKSALKSELYSLTIKFMKFLAGGIPVFYLAYIHPTEVARKLKAAQELHALLTEEQKRRLSLSPKKI